MPFVAYIDLQALLMYLNGLNAPNLTISAFQFHSNSFH